MDNREITALLYEMGDALEYFQEPFRARAYRKAAETVSMLETPVRTLLSDGTLTEIQGIGKGISTTLAEWESGDFSSLSRLTDKLPEGLSELLKVPGLGFKRIRELQSRGIETLEGLQSALDGGRLTSFKGLTPRYVDRIRRAIEDIVSGRGRILLNTAFDLAEYIAVILTSNGIDSCITGELRRVEETIGLIEFLIIDTGITGNELERIFKDNLEHTGKSFVLRLKKSPEIIFHLTDIRSFHTTLFQTTGSRSHLDKIREHFIRYGYEIDDIGIYKSGSQIYYESEETIYRSIGLQYIPPEIREGMNEVELALSGRIPQLLDETSIIGTIHNHTNYSDGRASVATMAQHAANLGCKWIGIADHSITAHYARGMNQRAIKKQHSEIDSLNRENSILILKGVECDIQADGSLDFSSDILETCDYVIASIHTNMDMDKASMTDRLITAVRNPETSILAHPTGRLLLSRSPYELDIDAVLEECLRQKVAVEINANPQRLDIDWKKAMEFASAGGMIAISPDAHDEQGLKDIRYGLMMARKGLVATGSCLNTFPVQDAMAILRHGK